MSPLCFHSRNRVSAIGHLLPDNYLLFAGGSTFDGSDDPAPFAAGIQDFHSLFGILLINNTDHADAAVKCAIHFMGINIAVLLNPAEQAADTAEAFRQERLLSHACSFRLFRNEE